MSLIASIIIRTLNEERWLEQALQSIKKQNINPNFYEIIIVDSGSQDKTLDISKKYGCRITHISKAEFTFGRSLNLGCSIARGRNLVFISGHCIPVGLNWLQDLIRPLEEGKVHYVYGRQIGHHITRFSEQQVFAKYFPASSSDAQGGFFCNNANAALRAEVWDNHNFDENLTGLEDMELAKRLIASNHVIDYIREASVIHIHEETWRSVRIRYKREAIALQKIMPEVHVHFVDFIRYFLSGFLHDSSVAVQERLFLKNISGIFMFRLMQYWGAYRGNRSHKILSQQKKERYFYPK